MPATAAATVSTAEDVVVLEDISWDTYCRLNDENFSPAIRISYFEGALEIMTLSARHEKWERMIEVLVHALVEALGLDCVSFGSVTMRRKDLRAGLEPDTCFYFGSMAAAMRDRDELNLHTDPAPDLAVEIDVSRRSLPKFPLYAALGIGEIWRAYKDEMVLYQLVDGEYRVILASNLLPGMTGVRLAQLLADGRALPVTEWLSRVRAAAAESKP